MADTKISALTVVAAVLAAQEFAVNDATVSKKATAAQIKAWANGLEFLGRTQLAADAADITVSFTARVGLFLLLADIVGYSGGGGIARWRPNNDAGANYSAVASEPSDATATSTINTDGLLLGETTQTVPRSPIFTVLSKASATQPGLATGISGDGSRVKGTAITMIQHAGVWDNVVDQISSIVLNGGGVNLLNGSWVEVYGIKNAASA